MVTEFCQNFKNTISGHLISNVNPKKKSSLEGGAKIKSFYYRLYKDFLGPYSSTQQYSDQDIERAIKLHEGYSIPGFPSIDVFIYLLQPSLDELKEPAQDCLNEVWCYLE